MEEDLTVWLCKQSPILCVNDIFNISHRRLLKTLSSVSIYIHIHVYMDLCMCCLKYCDHLSHTLYILRVDISHFSLRNALNVKVKGPIMLLCSNGVK